MGRKKGKKMISFGTDTQQLQQENVSILISAALQPIALEIKKSHLNHVFIFKLNWHNYSQHEQAPPKGFVNR